MVTFDYSARVVQDLTVVSSDTKPSLLNAIPSIPSGSTAIGQGKYDAYFLCLFGNEALFFKIDFRVHFT